MRPKKPSNRQRLKLVLEQQEPARRAKPAPMNPILKAALAPANPNPCSTYDPKIAQTILGRMWQGEFAYQICLDAGMPTIRTLQRWCKDHPDLRADYADARHAQADALAAQAVMIADNRRGDILETANGPMGNAANVLRDQLRFRARQWAAAKLYPQRYGEKSVEHGGEVIHRHMIDRPPEETREQWIERRRRELALPAPDHSSSPADAAQQA